jgi:hypothetical protein
MLKSFLQRFVRLHGMLFAAQDGQADRFTPSDFLAIQETALTDLRQLLKMSAFGDGLLLHMVVICIFSVTNARTGDDEVSHSQQGLSMRTDADGRAY